MLLFSSQFASALTARVFRHGRQCLRTRAAGARKCFVYWKCWFFCPLEYFWRVAGTRSLRSPPALHMSNFVASVSFVGVTVIFFCDFCLKRLVFFNSCCLLTSTAAFFFDYTRARVAGVCVRFQVDRHCVLDAILVNGQHILLITADPECSICPKHLIATRRGIQTGASAHCNAQS